MVVLVAGGKVQAETHHPHCTEGHPVRPILGIAVCNLDPVHLLLSVDRMRPRGLRVDDVLGGLLGEEFRDGVAVGCE